MSQTYSSSLVSTGRKYSILTAPGCQCSRSQSDFILVEQENPKTLRNNSLYFPSLNLFSSLSLFSISLFSYGCKAIILGWPAMFISQAIILHQPNAAPQLLLAQSLRIPGANSAQSAVLLSAAATPIGRIVSPWMPINETLSEARIGPTLGCAKLRILWAYMGQLAYDFDVHKKPTTFPIINRVTPEVGRATNFVYQNTLPKLQISL